MSDFISTDAQEISGTNLGLTREVNPSSPSSGQELGAKPLKVEIKVLRPQLKEFGLPRYGSAGAAGMDLFACHDEAVVLKPGDTQFFPTGMAVFMADRNLCAMILSRSGLGTKKGLVVKQGVGLIDADYQGEIIVALQNIDAEQRTVLPGERIAQIVFLPVLHPHLVAVAEFSDSTVRGAGGFGSTGGHS